MSRSKPASKGLAGLELLETEIEQIETRAGVLIKPAPLLEDWKRLSGKVAKKWPKKLSSVEAIREDRER